MLNRMAFNIFSLQGKIDFIYGYIFISHLKICIVRWVSCLCFTAGIESLVSFKT